LHPIYAHIRVWRVIEIGHIWFGPRLQRTIAATEAIYLLAQHVFDDLGYRRLEWKCNALNAASRRSAERLGFTFEGVFRKHQIVKVETETPLGMRSQMTSGPQFAMATKHG
jgi:RimJ/RimL family protein N-acetyltransferase